MSVQVSENECQHYWRPVIRQHPSEIQIFAVCSHCAKITRVTY